MLLRSCLTVSYFQKPCLAHLGDTVGCFAAVVEQAAVATALRGGVNTTEKCMLSVADPTSAACTEHCRVITPVTQCRLL